LVTRILCRSGRLAAVNASTVFAISLAIVAGLIFAWLFKTVLFAPKPTPKPVDDSVEVTVAATNLRDQTEIKTNNVKKIKLPRKEADSLAKSGRTLLKGQQPVGRVTKKSINAEEPFFEDDLLPFSYPEPVSKRLRNGWRAVIVTVGAKDAMVQVNDFVDVYATMSNDALGPGGNGTAEIAKGAKVVARFGTTAPAAQPRDLNAPREYTLEVTPYRYALIELAKTVGAKFSLTNAPAIVEGDKIDPPPGNDIQDPREQVAERVDGRDLAALFGIGPPPDAGPGPWVIDKYVGIKNAGHTSYPGYVPPSRQGTPPPATTPTTSGSESRAKPSSSTIPVSYIPPPTPRTLPPPTPRSRPSTAFNPTGAVASASGGFGFGAPRDPNAAKNCKT